MLNNNISLEDYHALPAMSAHNLMDVEDNPRIAEYNKAHHMKATAAMVNGTLIHTAIEIEQATDLEKHYACIPPDINKRTKAGKLQLEEFEAAIGDKIPITDKQWTMALACRQAAFAHPKAREYLEAAKFELSGFITIRGVEVKARPDLDNYESHRTLVDIKSRQKGAANVEKWLKDWWNYKTYIQAGLQLLVWEDMGMPCEHYYYMLVESAEPYEVHMVYMDDELIQIAKQKTLDVIVKWQRWTSQDSSSGLPGYGNPEAMVTKPWMRNLNQTI
tara:strand:- start:2613 stop:3437 length:825 start_codon:yes stop_codon:yes gene_type:complete